MTLRFASLSLALLALVACGQNNNTTLDADGNTITPIVVDAAVCRPTPNGRQATACYLNIVSAEDDRLTEIDTEGALNTQMHSSTEEGGMMMMRPIEGGVPLPAGEVFNFTPGGNHIMLNGVQTPLVEGDSVQMTLKFEKAPDMTLTVPVGQPTEANEGFPNG